MKIKSISVDINPNYPIPLAGYGNRKDSYSCIHDDLEINIAILFNENFLVAMIAIDTLFVGSEIQLFIENKLKNDFGICSVLIFASHTHFAPSMDSTKPKLGFIDPTYIREVKIKIENAVSRLLGMQFSDCNLNIKNLQNLRGSIYRRKKKVLSISKRGIAINKTVSAPNADIEIDSEAQIWEFTDKSNGNVVLAIFNWPCHPVSFPDDLKVSSDYVGYLRKNYRAANDNLDLPFVFALGFAGDIRPNTPPKKALSIKDNLKFAINGVQFGKFNYTEWTQWCESLCHQFCAAEILTANEPIKHMKQGEVRSHNKDIFYGDGISELVIKYVRLNSSLLIAVNFEVSNLYVKMAKEVFSELNVICTSCSGVTTGYFPHHNQLKNGGYEVSGFQDAFNVKGIFNKEISETFETLLYKIYDELT
jgi:hypothetical protein